jgi:hypothetical protein
MDRSRRPRRTFASCFFCVGLWFFALGAAGSLAAVALGVVSQMKVLGGITLLCSLAGAAVCALGVKLYRPAEWRTLRRSVDSLGESLRDATEAIGEPRMAYARVAAQPVARPTVVWPAGHSH